MKKEKGSTTVAEAGRRGGNARAKLPAEELSRLGKLGGAVGGPARAKSLTKQRRSEIASKAAKARWGKKKP